MYYNNKETTLTITKKHMLDNYTIYYCYLKFGVYFLSSNYYFDICGYLQCLHSAGPHTQAPPASHHEAGTLTSR